MKIGVLGLGKMGSRIATKLYSEGHDVIAWNRSEISLNKIKTAKSIKELILKLDKPRVLWLMLPAGEPTQEVLSELKKYVEKGDIIIDGGNRSEEHTSELQSRQYLV